MKRFLTLLLLLVTLTVSSQARLGRTLTELKAEFPSSVYDVEFSPTQEKTILMVIKFDDAYVMHYLNKYNVCIATGINPLTMDAAIFLKNKYDKLYRKSGSYKWVGDTFAIYLEKEDDKIVFIWYDTDQGEKVPMRI